MPRHSIIAGMLRNSELGQRKRGEERSLVIEGTQSHGSSSKPHEIRSFEHDNQIAQPPGPETSRKDEKLGLRKFPPEIREKIFEGCIHTSDNTSPNIIRALRSEPALYFEALPLFYKLNWFMLNAETLVYLQVKMSDSAISGIRKLFIK